MESERQECLDRFYLKTGPCCAGCDWWRSLNSVVGECHRSAPVSSAGRLAMLDMKSSSLAPAAGHVLTTREHVCGEFKDDFDWPSLPLWYRKRIAA